MFSEGLTYYELIFFEQIDCSFIQFFLIISEQIVIKKNKSLTQKITELLGIIIPLIPVLIKT